MARSLAWILPLIFVVIAVVYGMGGQVVVAGLYLSLAAGLGLHAYGTLRGLGPMRWTGAAIAGFVLVILLWLAFAR